LLEAKSDTIINKFVQYKEENEGGKILSVLRQVQKIPEFDEKIFKNGTLLGFSKNRKISKHGPLWKIQL